MLHGGRNVLPCIEATPWGAGLCVRRSVADLYWRIGHVLKQPIITGRVGNVLLSGDDVELCYVATSLGLGVANVSRTESASPNTQRTNVSILFGENYPGS